MTGMSEPHVVIIGGGFGGLYAAKELKSAPVRITLVDRRNHHLFQPLLYQVATAALNPSDIATAIRHVLRKQKNALVMMGEVTRIDPAAKRVVIGDRELEYDFLIMAPGATHSYFGHDQWAIHAPGLKSVEDALAIRRKILLAFEAAEQETDEERRRAWMTFVVVGGGPTGVELAGSIAEIARKAMAGDFRRIDTREARVILLEGSPRVLTSYPESLSESAKRQLERLGVDVKTGAMVTSIDADGVTIGDDRLAAKTVLWAAGVKAPPVLASLGAPLDRAGRVLVQRDLTIPGHPDVFVVGDAAVVEQNGKPVPGVAPAAIQMGRHAARCVRLQLKGRSNEEFRYQDKGSLATIGRAAAVADLPPRIRFSGFAAWIAWLTIHIFFLIGFRNRLLVVIQWAWAYLTWQRGARLITGERDDRGK